MIRRQFSVFEVVGPARERAIRAAGVADWDGFLAADGIPGMPARLQCSVAGQILEWTAALERRDAGFFARAAPRSAHWVLFEEFGDGVRYLDTHDSRKHTLGEKKALRE